MSDAGKAGAFRGLGIPLEPLPLDGRPPKSRVFPGVRVAFTPSVAPGPSDLAAKTLQKTPGFGYECIEFLFPPGFKIQMIAGVPYWHGRAFFLMHLR